jgi:hypothetical protein
MLVVLSDPEAADSALSSAPESDTGTELVIDSDGQGDSATPEFSIEESDSETADVPAFSFEDGTAGASGSMTARRARAQRHQKSALKEMIKVVGGGVIGLTIGQLILWWLPGDLKRDPIDLGPKIPSFAAFLVHPDFRADSIAKKKDGEEAAQPTPLGPTGDQFDFRTADNNTLPSSSFGGLIDTKQDLDDTKKMNNDDASVAGEEGSPGQLTDPSDDSSDPLKTETGDDIFSGKPDFEIPQINLQAFPTAPEDSQPSDNDTPIPDISPPTVDPSTTSPVPTPSTPRQAEPSEFNGVRNAPSISVDQLSSRLTLAVSASIAMDTPSSESANQLTLAKDFYMTMAGLGEAITFVDQVSAPDAVNEVGKFALEVGKQADKLDLIGKVAPSWMKNRRPHNGLVVCGIVDSIDFTAPYYVTSLVLPNKSVHKIVSINDPSGDYQPQDKILVLGSILDAPQQNLENYQGEATTVILDGLHATLPTAE